MGTGGLGLYSDMIIERIKSIVVTTYDGEDLHILDVRATELRQALEADIYGVYL